MPTARHTQIELDAIRSFTVPTLMNAIETFGVLPNNTGYCDGTIQCRFPDLPLMLGYATTARVSTDQPLSQVRPGINEPDYWRYIANQPGPKVAVVQDSDNPPMGALWGEWNSNVHKALGCVGMVTLGAARDLDAVSKLLIAARGSRMEALLYLAVSTGMRQMEILGLKWSDLDWLKKTLKVERQLVRGKGVKFSQPKTRHGRRIVVLGDRTIETLRRNYERQNEERIKSGESWSEHGLIFTMANGSPIHFRVLMRYFKNLLKVAGLPEIRFHDLRHTAASLMLNHGIPVIIVSRRMGHARPSITLDIYDHLVPGMQEEEAQMIDELITPVELHPTAPDLYGR